MLFHRKKIWLNSLFLVLPTIGIFAFGLFLTIAWRYPDGLLPESFALHVRIFSVIGLLWLLLYYGFGLLSLRALKRFDQLASALLGAHLVGFVGAVVILYAQPNLLITPRRFLVVDTVLVFVLSFFWQILIRFSTKKYVHQQIFFVNLDHAYQEMKNELQEHSMSVHTITEADLFSLTKKTHRLHQSFTFVVPISPTFSTETLEVCAHLHAHGATFVQLDAFYEQVFRRVYMAHVNDWWLLENIEQEIHGLYPLFKRIYDLFFALLIALVFFLTFPIVALAIKLTDRDHIFFTQKRLSVHGVPFTIYKYRTMRAETPNNTWTADHDPRVTGVGRFLRATRIDELPQWINIMRGDMSLIGPRPEQAGVVEQLKEEIPYFESRHAVRPGLIGWAQLHVYAGTIKESKQKLQYDLYYLKHRSFLFDLEILLKTIAHVFFLRGK